MRSMFRGIYAEIAEEETARLVENGITEKKVTADAVKMSIRRGNPRLQARFVEIANARKETRRQFEALREAV
ncbi:hypothetical protein Ctha_0285 [Chloroherpeton thalassium ATCC 35110]|uniref:Uncharacterized protein n=2 Tax=Chloroherpeton thalassium TaxID=100716 RepID=B3QTL0_CHLT3|nr:hypothetical protein Ctha_0285 [Chloroherpeton thalassium ATCC 35110]